tara:strand:+ start:474 stop:647 length:174 start_codon:yes stop_codon:yes gene_type:complete
MPFYYREGNLIVRSDSYEKLDFKLNKREIKNELWKKKVKKDNNDISKLEKNNFPKLR